MHLSLAANQRASGHRRPEIGRNVSVLLACAMVASSAVGGRSLASAQSAGASMTINILDYWSGPPSGVQFPNFLKQYKSTHPGITFNDVHVPQASLVNKVLQEAAAHQEPDLIIADGPNTPALASAGALVSLDTLAKGYPVDKLFLSGPLNAGRWQGHLYGLPIGANCEAIIYNKSMLAAAHLSVPTTWAEFSHAAKVLTHGSTYGFAASASAAEETTWDWEPYLWEAGGDLGNVASPAAVKALNWWSSLVTNGSEPRAVLTESSADFEPQFIQGKLAMMQMGIWNIPSLVQDAKAHHIVWGETVVPVPQAGQKTIVPFGGEVFSIGNTTAAKQQAVWDFMKWLQNPAILIPFDAALGYVPAYAPADKAFVQKHPEFSAFAQELQHSQSRTSILGAKYGGASQAIWIAIQKAMNGTSAPSALSEAQQTIQGL